MSNFCIRKLPAYALLLLFDVLFVAFIGALIVVGMPGIAYAYVDPSVMTYAIQAIAGVAVAIGATAGVVFRKTRKKIMQLLKIDENAGQVVDPFVERCTGADGALNDADAVAAVESSVEESSAAESATIKPVVSDSVDAQMHDPVGCYKRKLKNETLTSKQRLIFALVVSLFTWSTLFFFAPVEIIVSSAGDFLFTAADLWIELLCAIVVSVGVSTFVVSRFKGKIYKLMLGLLFALGACFWVQAMFLNGGLPTADGADVAWDSYTLQNFGSIVVWLALIAAGALISQKWTHFRTGAAVVSCCLIFVQFVGLVSLAFPLIDDSNDAQVAAGAESEGTTISLGSGITENTLFTTEAGKFTVSSKNNVIVIVLDTFNQKVADELYAEKPELFAEYDGFIMYTNTTGVINPTRYALPAILTGRTIQDDETFSEYINTLWENHSFYDTIKNANYQMGIYSSVASKTFSYGYAMNVTTERPTYEIREKKAVKAIVQLSCARDLPWLFKQFFWYDTETLSSSVLKKIKTADPDVTADDQNTANYFARLKTFGLSIDDEDSSYDGAFRFIHLYGAHKPYKLTATGEASTTGATDVKTQSEGSLYIVSYYLQQLKELGVYDDATIIVMADHGYRNAYAEGTDITDTQAYTACPLFMIKPSASSEYSTVGHGFTTTDMPVSLIDFRATVAQAITGDGSEYGTSVLDASDYSRVRTTMWSHKTGSVDTFIASFNVYGNSHKGSNWEFIRTWENDGTRLHWDKAW